jgi:hypothetical protein
MAPLVLLKGADRGNALVPERVRWRARVAARLRANRLDAELAHRAAPTRAALPCAPRTSASVRHASG